MIDILSGGTMFHDMGYAGRPPHIEPSSASAKEGEKWNIGGAFEGTYLADKSLAFCPSGAASALLRVKAPDADR